MKKIRVLLVDDQPLFRGAVAALLGRHPDLDVVGEAENGLDAVEQAVALRPDLVIMDVEMPVMSGVDAAPLILERVMDVKIIMLTVSETDEHVSTALMNGAHGYLLKNLRPDQLFDMIAAVMKDETPISPAVAGHLLNQLKNGGAPGAAGVRPVLPPAGPAQPLTRRELEILRLAAGGLTNKEIARDLVIAEGTVKTHIHNALEKLQMTNRIQAAAYIVRQGWGRPVA